MRTQIRELAEEMHRQKNGERVFDAAKEFTWREAVDAATVIIECREKEKIRTLPEYWRAGSAIKDCEED